jgi:hypothetical protein
MAAHRYWRIRQRINAGGTTYSGVTEIEMAETAGGADVTSSTFGFCSLTPQAGTVANAFDNNTTTRLQVTGTSIYWVGQDFGAGNEKDIAEVRIWPNTDAANRTFGEFDIEWSDDGATYTTAWSCSYTAWVIVTSVTFTKPSALASRYWRVRADTVGSGNNMSCAECEMRETASGADQTGSGTASARTTFSGSPASNAFDNNSSTLWSGTSGVDDCEWLAYDFGAGVTKAIDEISWTARSDSALFQNPTAGWLESSPDGRSWRTRRTFSGVTWSTLGQTQTIIAASSGGARRFSSLMLM